MTQITRDDAWLATYFKARDRSSWSALMEKCDVGAMRAEAIAEADFLLAEFDKRFPVVKEEQ